MSLYTHTVVAGENPWNFVKDSISAGGGALMQI